MSINKKGKHSYFIHKHIIRFSVNNCGKEKTKNYQQV